MFHFSKDKVGLELGDVEQMNKREQK